jgi:hypothetical protein
VAAKFGPALPSIVHTWDAKRIEGWSPNTHRQSWPFSHKRVDHWLCLDCARNKHSTEYGIADTGHCENCGREIWHWDFSQPMPSACCSDCRRMAANKRSRERRRVMHEPVTCEKCGEMFEPTRSDSRFCSSRCRQKACRTRVREKPRSLLPCLGGRGRPGQMMCELQDDPAGPHFSLRTTHHTTERQCK